ncbi:MAG TPA: glycosyltransferase, partial [Solirubrobacteraceae bacterium]|nr:glycosyltransferase [Solirubrobacteraceae bacterium]
IVYCTATSALLAPRPGAVRFDAEHAANRPGRHGIWQRGREKGVLAGAPLLIPMSDDALFEASLEGEAVVIPVPVEPSGSPVERDIAAITYASDPVKKGLPRVLEAWAQARRGDEELVVVTDKEVPAQPGVRVEDVRGDAFRALVRRARVYVVAPRREDYGITQLEALADGCMLVTTEGEGPYVAREIAHQLDQRLVGDDLAFAIRAALDAPEPGYAEHARELLRPFAPAAVDAAVANELLPRLLPA